MQKVASLIHTVIKLKLKDNAAKNHQRFKNYFFLFFFQYPYGIIIILCQNDFQDFPNQCSCDILQESDQNESEQYCKAKLVLHGGQDFRQKIEH